MNRCKYLFYSEIIILLKRNYPLPADHLAIAMGYPPQLWALARLISIVKKSKPANMCSGNAKINLLRLWLPVMSSDRIKTNCLNYFRTKHIGEFYFQFH